MAPLLKLVFSAVIVAGTLAFPIQSKVAPSHTQKIFLPAPLTVPSSRFQDMSSASSALRIRGGGPASASSAAAAPTKPKKVRIAAFDSMRFFLIACIVLGHFISFANPSDFLFKFVSQHNVVVGAFFALGGYVTAYTSTENAKREPSARLLTTPKPKWILSRIFGYFPLHLVVLLLFSPMFLFVDVTYNGWLKAAWHGLLSVTLTQAWFPLSAEIWNAPTWYLSALNFITAIMPFSLPSIAKLDKKQLRRTGFWLFMAMILPKIGYLYDFNTFGLAEGITSPKVHPNLALFNMLRFSPLHNVAEALLGAVACRLVMLDDDPDEKELKPKTNALSTSLPLAAILGVTYLRAAGILNISEFVARHALFVPLFLRFLMSCHRNTVNGVSDPTSSVLSHPFLVWLGNLSFPIFIVHGPLGQLFFKKLIANKLFGGVLSGPVNFGYYLASLVATAWILQKTVLQNKAIGDWSKSTVEKLSEWA